MKGFLYGQTEYNIGKCANHLEEYVQMAKDNSFDFLTITDSNLYGNYKFYNSCINKGIKPVIGLEYSYITEDQNYSKVILYAMNNSGYRNLLKISSLQKNKKINELKDIVDYQNGLSFIFVFNDSYIERLLYSREYGMLKDFIEGLQAFKDMYIGVSFTNRLDKNPINKSMLNYAKENGIRTIPVHQCKYLRNKDVCVYEALTEIAEAPDKIGDYDDYSFEESPIESEEINSFISRIDISLFKDKIELPKYPNTKGKTSYEFLHALCYKGLERRGKNYDNYVKRLEYELGVIHQMGYDDYFLIVWDFIKYSKQNGILVGPGRGSAAGSLVSYTLGITEVDPLQYDLLFERFLNPERVSMPDIDTDFPDVDRDKVIDYVKSVYGEDHVCNISAYGTFKDKSAIRDLGRIRKIDQSRLDKIIDMVEDESIGFDKLLESYKDSDLYEFLYVAKSLIDFPRNLSTHAAGIVLSGVPLDDIIPTQPGLCGLYQSQLEAVDLEKIGLLKMDFLALSNLTMIDGMMKDIGSFGLKELRNIPLDDKKTYNVLASGDTLGIFQLEKQGITNVLKKLKPTNFEDLVAVLALYRPGPMDNIDEFIRRRHGGRFDYIHPKLEPILKSTYGIIVYQEQIMKIAQEFAGYSLGEADILRRAISKKKVEILKQSEAEFITRSVKLGNEEKVAKEIYDLIYKFADYGFNRSHSVAYGMLAYQMAWFKANYFKEFIGNIANNVISNSTTIASYIKYARAHGVVTHKPNVNISTDKFVSTPQGLFLPLKAISGIGDVVCSGIVDERNKNGLFKDLDDFKNRCQFISSANYEALVFSGALDIFGQTKKQMMNVSTKKDDIFLEFINKKTDESEFEFEDLMEKEKTYLKMNLEYSLFTNYQDKLKRCKAVPLSSMKYNQESRILVVVNAVKEIKTKKGEAMLVGDIEDSNITKKFVIFPRTLSELTERIERNKMYLALAKLDKDTKNNEDSIVINRIAEMKF